MCDPIAAGGKRCASHTRPLYEAAAFGTQEWDDAAADYAATPSGRTALEHEAQAAGADGDLDRESALRSALKVGEGRRQAYLEIREQVAALRESFREEKDDRYWVTEMLTCIYSADKIVDRGEALFFEDDNPIEIAAARQHVIDLDTAARRLSADFRDTHAALPWKQLARMRDRNAHHYDNINRAIVWNVLVEEFPKIRVALRDFLKV